METLNPQPETLNPKPETLNTQVDELLSRFPDTETEEMPAERAPLTANFRCLGFRVQGLKI